MTKLAFVRCALEAALAHKNFGMRFFFRYENGEDLAIRGYDNFFAYANTSLDIKYYLADESLPLLDPQSDDIMMHYVEYVAGYGGVNEKEYYLTWKETKPYYDGTEKPLPEFHPLAEPIIIRRNGKPFPTIEYEDAP